jgi:hypothetical protein
MAENQSAEDEFLGDLANNGSQDPFDGTPDDLFEAPTEPKEEEVVEEKVEKALPFNKDPKIQRFIEKQVERKLSERTIEQPVRESRIDASESPYGDILKTIIGDDTPEKRNAIDKFNRTFLEREERITSSIREESNQERQAEVQAEVEAEDTLMTGFENIEDSYGVDLYAPENKKLKGQFIDFIKKVAPKDEYGEIADFPDIEGTFETFQSLRQRSSQTERGKDLASRSTERGSNSSAPTIKEQPTFDNIESMFDRLAG